MTVSLAFTVRRMFSLLYYLCILSHPRPNVKGYFAEIFDELQHKNPEKAHFSGFGRLSINPFVGAGAYDGPF